MNIFKNIFFFFFFFFTNLKIYIIIIKTYKLGDMNVSKIQSKNEKGCTQTGTPYYSCPETWRDEKYSEKSDIWSVGVVLYEAMFLEPPFQSQTMEGLCLKVLQGQYSIPSPHLYSDNLIQIVQALL